MEGAMGQTYARDMRKTAYRHLEAAEHLYNSTGRRDVAGYLFGIAAECALKQIMLDSGMRPLAADKRRDDPFYAHFEDLKTLLRDTSEGRRSGELIALATDNSFMQNWDVSMRYSHGKDIDPRWIEKWLRDARDVVGMMDS
jgi:HEPN domain-containing protein